MKYLFSFWLKVSHGGQRLRMEAEPPVENKCSSQFVEKDIVIGNGGNGYQAVRPGSEGHQRNLDSGSGAVRLRGAVWLLRHWNEPKALHLRDISICKDIHERKLHSTDW